MHFSKDSTKKNFCGILWIKYAMAAMISVCLLFLVGMILANNRKKNAAAPPPVTDISLIDQPTEKEKQAIAEPPKPKIAEIKTIKFTVPKIVAENVEKDIPPPQDMLNDMKIAPITNNGKDFGDIVLPPVEKSAAPGITLKTAETDIPENPIIVQIEAKFPGGSQAWERFLQTNLNTSLPVDNGAPSGSYTVIVSFLVDRQGNVSEVLALNDPGYGTPDEAVRVIKKSKQWIPAIQNGRNVTYRQKQKITFIVYEN